MAHVTRRRGLEMTRNMNLFFWVPATAKPPHQKALRLISRNEGSELSNATIVPQGDAVADMTRKMTVFHGRVLGP